MRDIKIIYEDNNILVLNKPAGLLVHAVKDSKEKTLIDWLIKKYPDIKGVGDPSTSSGQDNLRPGIVHRLDKDTSGVLLTAKNQKTFEYLKKQFQQRDIKKKYVVLVHGIVKNKEGIIDLPIARSKKDFRRKTSAGKTRGESREAVTEYKVIKKFSEYTFVEAYPKTGRTHQIRVHFKSIGHPVVCDRLYGNKKVICPFGLSRHFLHASSVEFTALDGIRVKFGADLPDDLQNTLNMLN